MLDPTIRWTDRLLSSSGDWSGNLFDFFFRVSPKLSKNLKVPFKLEGITRIDDTPVHKALREALANCIVNTDFFVSRGIVIRKDDEKIVIENPGYIRTGKDQMLKGGISDPRNKALMKMFNMIGIGERAGSGVPDIFSVWESNGWIPPEIDEQYNPDRTILTLSFKKKSAESAEKLSSRHQQILSLMEVGREYSSDEIAKIIGLKGSRTRQLLKDLVDNALITATPGTKNRRYIK